MIVEAILISAGVILAVWGLSELLHTIRLATILRKKEVKLLSVVFLKPSSAILQLSFALEQKRWLGGDFAEYVVGVTDAIEGEELGVCKRFAKENGLILCQKSEFLRVADNLTFKI